MSWYFIPPIHHLLRVDGFDLVHLAAFHLRQFLRSLAGKEGAEADALAPGVVLTVLDGLRQCLAYGVRQKEEKSGSYQGGEAGHQHWKVRVDLGLGARKDKGSL